MILASGAFDGLHAGHIRYLHAAAAINPALPLVVAVAPDSYILSKGRAVGWSQKERAIAVQGIARVPSTIQHSPDSVAALFREHRVTLFVKGMDWWGKLPADVVEACRANGAAIVFVQTPGRHTSEAKG